MSCGQRPFWTLHYVPARPSCKRRAIAMVGTSGRSPAPWAPPSKALGRHQRRTQRAEALIASMYLAGVNTRRVERALGSLFWTLLPSGQILMHKLDGWAIVSQPIQPINHQGIQWPVLSLRHRPVHASLSSRSSGCNKDCQPKRNPLTNSGPI